MQKLLFYVLYHLLYITVGKKSISEIRIEKAQREKNYLLLYYHDTVFSYTSILSNHSGKDIRRQILLQNLIRIYLDNKVHLGFLHSADQKFSQDNISLPPEIVELFGIVGLEEFVLTINKIEDKEFNQEKLYEYVEKLCVFSREFNGLNSLK